VIIGVYPNNGINIYGSVRFFLSIVGESSMVVEVAMRDLMEG